MKSIISALFTVVIINVLATAGFVGWLGVSGRISKQRLEVTIDLFRPTVVADLAEQEQVEKLADEQAQTRQEVARLAAAAAGPQTLPQRLESQLMDDQIARAHLDRLKRETRDLQQRLEGDKRLIAGLKADLDADRAEFEASTAQRNRLVEDADFREVVEMYEQLKPAQAKDAFNRLITLGEIDQVVEYLSAMEKRKSGAVLKTFKDPQDIVVAVDLLERLRRRGVRDKPVGGPLAQGGAK